MTSHSESSSPLMLLLDAVWRGDAEATKTLLAREDVTPADKSEALAEAARQDCAIDCMRALWEQADHRAADASDGRTVLLAAAAAGAVECVKLAMTDCDFEAREKQSGRTALMVAVEERRKDIVALLAPFSDLAAVDKNGLNALRIAWIAREAEICRLVASPEACAALADPEDLLRQAAARGWAAGVEILAPFVNVDALEEGGRGALWHAAASGNVEAVQAVWRAGRALRAPEAAADVALRASTTSQGSGLGNPCTDWIGLRLPVERQEALWEALLGTIRSNAAGEERKKASALSLAKSLWPDLAKAVEAEQERRALLAATTDATLLARPEDGESPPEKAAREPRRKPKAL